MREVVGGGWWKSWSYNGTTVFIMEWGERQDNFHPWVALLVSQQWKLPVSSAEQSVGIQAEEHNGFPHYESYRNSVTIGVEVFSGKGYWSIPQSRSLETIITPTTWLVMTLPSFFVHGYSQRSQLSWSLGFFLCSYSPCFAPVCC